MMTQHKIGALAVAGYADYLLGGARDRRPGDYYLGREGTPTIVPGTWYGGARAGMEQGKPSGFAAYLGGP